MVTTTDLTFPSLIGNTINTFGSHNALAYAGEEPMTYDEMSDKIQSLIAFFETADIKPGEKIAIYSSNMPEWALVYFATTFMGAVTVPLLPDFTPLEVANILQHSEAKLLFVSKSLLSKTENLKTDFLHTKVLINDFSIIESTKNISYTHLAKPISVYDVKENDLASIIYTSGTTGKSKGAMLTHKNITSNAIAGGKVQPIDEHDRFLSVLPLSHTYENTLGLIFPMVYGSCVYYLRQAPTPAILLPALEKIKPTIMLAVPLIIEKIYRNKIKPAFNKTVLTRSLYAIPFMRKKLNAVAGKKLMQTFGGKIKFFGIGGAKLNEEVEHFLIEAHFPYAIGYGLTETAPLLAGLSPANVRLQSTGPAVDGVSLKLNDINPETGQGEIWAKGPNVMMGYYKEPELTAEVMTPDGWFKTGDLGAFDEDGFLFIKGRIKNVIVGASGENIYPEDIESLINNFNHVIESLVVEEKGKLVALVHFNIDEIEKRYQSVKDDVSNYVDLKTEELRKELQQYINTKVNKFSRIQNVIKQAEPFEKTATQKIKRFLYTKHL